MTNSIDSISKMRHYESIHPVDWGFSVGTILHSSRLAGALFFATAAFAQFSSSVEGTVNDSQQANVPAATVLLVNESTQVTRQTATSDNGFFRIAELPPGGYRLEVRREGFKTWVQTNLILEGSAVRTVYPILAVGEQAIQVEVTAVANAIETGRSNISRSVEEKTISEVPMLGRNVYAAIVALAPGVTGSGALYGSGSAVAQDSFQAEPGFQINAAGQRQEQNEYQVDGTSVNGNSRDGIANLTPQPDTIQEVRVSANSFSAEKGRNSGALVEVFTKSGGNKLHGSLSEYHTNNALTSRTIFQSALPASRRNEYGFTLGGPVIKNRTFFFVSYFGLNTSVASTSVVRLETPEFVNFVKGRFPNSLAAKFLTLDNPVSYPTTAISTVSQVRQANPGSFASDLFPADLPAVGTATITQPVPQPSRAWNVRIDQNLRDYKDRVYFSFFLPSEDGTVLSTRKALTYPYPTTNPFARLSWTHTFTPALLNEASVSVVRAGGHYPPANGEAALLPNVNISGISTGFNQAGYYRFQHNNYIMHDGLTWLRSGHQIKFGFDVDRQQGYAVQSNNARPTFQFSNILDFAQDLPFSQAGPTIDIAHGDTASNLYRKLYSLYAAPYVQDDWKATPRLTLNLGLRWDYFGHWATGHQGDIPFPIFTPGSGGTFAEQVTSGTMKVRGDGYFATNRPNGIAPRIGLAWDVFGNGSTSVRAGYGIYYSRVANLAYGTNGSNTNPPAFGSPALTIQQAGTRFGYGLGSAGGYYFPPPPGFTFGINASGGIIGSRVSVGGMDAVPSQPSTQSWTFSVQRRLGGNFVAEADYLGTHSDHLYTQSDVNRFAGNLLSTNGSLTRLNPNFGPIIFGQTIGTSKGNIFSFSLGRRFARGWSARAIFTTGRALDVDSSNDNGVPNGRNILDIANLQRQFGRADYDINRRLAVDAVWELPNPFQAAILKNTLGGWKLATIAILQSGLPYTVFTSASYASGGDFNADGYNFDVPNAPPGSTRTPSRSDFITGVFQRADFPLPPKGQQGNLGRNTFEGPGLANVNLNIIKSIRLPWFYGGEGCVLDLRGEMFNVLNRVNLNLPTSDLSNGLFGKSTSQKQPRAVQFGVRLQF